MIDTKNLSCGGKSTFRADLYTVAAPSSEISNQFLKTIIKLRELFANYTYCRWQ